MHLTRADYSFHRYINPQKSQSASPPLIRSSAKRTWRNGTRRIPVVLRRLWLRFVFLSFFLPSTRLTFCQIALLWKDAPENPNRGQGPKARKPRTPKEPKAPKAKAKTGAKKAKKVEVEDEDAENSDPVEASNDDEEWLMLVSRPFFIHLFIFLFMNGSYTQCGALRVPHCSLATVILISIDSFSFSAIRMLLFIIFSCLIIASSTHCATSLSL